MPALIIISSIVLLLAFLLSLKFTLTVAYAGEVQLWARVLFLKIRLVPAKEKRLPRSMSAAKARRLKKRRIKKLKKKIEKQRSKEEEKKQKKHDVAIGKEEEKKRSPADILDIISLVCNLVTKLVAKFLGHLRIRLARINIKVASDNAATTAVLYGAVTQAINVLFPLLDGIKTLRTPKNSDINVYADFCSEEPEIDIEISFSLRVWHLLHVALVALVQLIKYYFKSAARQDGDSDTDTDAEPQKKARSSKGHKV